MIYPEIYSNLEWAKVRVGEWPIIRLRQVSGSVWILVVHDKILQFVIPTICELLVRKNKIHHTSRGRKLQRIYLYYSLVSVSSVLYIMLGKSFN